MLPRPSSPTSLLWAHQLKREHEHLLDRVKDIAKSQEVHNVKVNAIETSNERMKSRFGQLEDIATRISAIEAENHDMKEWIEELDEEKQTKLGGDDKEIVRLVHQVATLDSHAKKMGVEVQQTLSTYQMVMKKIEDFEARIQKQGKTEKLRRKNDPVDVTVLTRRLDAMDSRQKDDAKRTETLLGRMEVLEEVNRQLSTRSAQFQAEIERLKSNAKNQHETARGTPKVRTGLDLEQDWSPSSLHIPHSQRAGNPSQSSLGKHNLLGDSPALNVQLRRSARTAPQSHPEGLVRLMPSKITAATSMMEQGDIYAKNIRGAANSRKKREAVSSQDLQQATSRVKPAVENVVQMSNLLKNSVTSLKHPKVDQKLSKPDKLRPVLPSQRRRRRQIPQVQDLDSFASMAGFSHI